MKRSSHSELVADRVFGQLEHATRTARLKSQFVETQHFPMCGRALPVVQQGVGEDRQRQRRVFATVERVDTATFDLLNQSQFGQR